MMKYNIYLSTLKLFSIQKAYLYVTSIAPVFVQLFNIMSLY